MTNVEYDNEKEYNEVIDKFEPIPEFPMSIKDMESLKASATVSIAISLKRIADKLELAQKQPIIMDAEQYKKYSETTNGH